MAYQGVSAIMRKIFDWKRSKMSVLEAEVVSRRSRFRVKVRVTLGLTVSHYVLVSIPLCGRLTRYCFLFKSLGLESVVLSLWGALSDERSGLSFVSHSLVICLCVHLLFTFLSFAHLSYTYVYGKCVKDIYIYKRIYTL
jgi:hypothetical protein